MRKILFSFATLLLTLSALTSCDKSDSTEQEPNISVSATSDPEYSQLKLISYNILQGMKNDKENNYDNFVAWVKEQNPDVLALQETNGFTEETLLELCKRWGHSYAVLNPNKSGYTVSMTSRYPIEVVGKYLDPDQNRGAIHAKVEGINFVVLHLYPFGTHPYGEGPTGSGEDYRVEEVSLYLDNTIRKYPEEKYWLMMGDFNAPSEVDKNYLSGSWEFRVHYEVTNSGYYDLVNMNHNRFMRSTSSNRIDFIYGSQAIASNVISADIIYDDFTDVWTEHASDHYPVCTVFRYKK